ncbi:MAG: HPr-rel-A system PqqD family peptide chaperone [Phycisphaerae bacterium]
MSNTETRKKNASTAMPESDGARPLARRDVRIHELDGEALIYDPVSGDTHHLNETAFFVWNDCDGTTSMSRIVDHLVESFDVQRPEAAAHVERVLDDFRARKLAGQAGGQEGMANGE